MPEERTAEKNKAIDFALTQIEKQFGKGSIMRLGQKDALVPVEVIPTGALSLDSALGIGGMPRGRVVEVFGPESSGKTTLRCTWLQKHRSGGHGGVHRRRARA